MTDNRTLDEVKSNDIDMLEQLIKKAKDYYFYNMKEAIAFTHKALFSTLAKHGVIVNERMHGKMVDRLLNNNNVRVESRNYDKQEDEWRSGIYVYKTDTGEMLAFISGITQKKSNIFTSIFHSARFVIKTNVQV